MKTNLLVAALALSLAPPAFSQQLIADSVRASGASGSASCLIALGGGYGSSSVFADYMAIAIGERAHADNYGIALGAGAFAGWSALSLGESSAAEGDYSAVVGGYGNYAPGHYSYALGNMASAWSDDSLSYGYYTGASSDYSIALGSKNLGSYTYGYPNLSDGWVEDAVLFELGNGEPSGSDHYRYGLSNAITTLKNGQTTLTNKAWLNRDSGTSATADPSSATTDSGGEALVVEGHTRLKGKVIIEQPQGDISMGIYQ